MIPENTMVLPSLLAVQSHPRYWSPDPLVWRPSRWILPSSSLDNEVFYTPPKGSYLPWSEGARGCLGKKFSQVEFVGAISTLFRDHVLEPVTHSGESREEARKRMQDVVDDSGLVLLLQMLRPEKAGVRWVKRKP